ncbi:MAG: RNB domain-containing ribonuclease [Acidobacteriales bacterium]|nr:RNB domain-containing ribonuclease [Terriglobales bacterium]
MNPASLRPVDLRAAALQLLQQNGFDPVFPAEVDLQLSQIIKSPPAATIDSNVRDLRSLLWSSIDNDTSRDLDQIEVAASLPDGQIKVWVAIADVDVAVPKGSPIDRHASRETTTVYTGVETFPMLPEKLSTDLTSLEEGEDRLSIVLEFVVGPDGSVNSPNIYRAVVRNQAQLAYPSVGAWLENAGPAPAKIAASADLQSQLKLQYAAARSLRAERYRRGALNIETIEVHPVMVNDRVTGVEKQEQNAATELIEDFMIAANEVVARILSDRQVPSLRRVVKTPKRWDRIVEIAATDGVHLPADPDSKALNDFLVKRKAADPDHFADLSLAVIKLMGPGEYVVQRPGEPEQGHFGLAVDDYTHSTAPNRRFADLVSQRLVKAVLASRPAPYTDGELDSIAQNCTLKADSARKVEREVSKRIAAVAMSGKVGEVFDAIVTGVTPKGTFVRTLQPHVEGLLVHGNSGVDVGDRVRVKLISTDVQRGYIDFEKI